MAQAHTQVRNGTLSRDPASRFAPGGYEFLLLPPPHVGVTLNVTERGVLGFQGGARVKFAEIPANRRADRFSSSPGTFWLRGDVKEVGHMRGDGLVEK